MSRGSVAVTSWGRGAAKSAASRVAAACGSPVNSAPGSWQAVRTHHWNPSRPLCRIAVQLPWVTRLWEIAVSGQHADPAAAAGVSFDTVFASSIFRIAYGPGFLGPGQDTGGYAASLAEMQIAYLVTGPRM